MPVDKFGRMSDAKTWDTGVSLNYINNNYIRNDRSTPVFGSINMNGNILYNVPDPGMWRTMLKNLKTKTMFSFPLGKLIWRVTNFQVCLFHQKAMKMLRRSMQIK